MIDTNKLNAAILELEKSSEELNNISLVVENAKELVSKHIESEDKLEEITKKVLRIAERCEENEKVMGDELRSLIMDMNSKNIRLFDEYHKEMDFNYNSLKTEISIVAKKSADGICESLNTETTKIAETVNKLAEKNEQDKNFVLKELEEIKVFIGESEKLNRIYFICKVSLTCVMFAVVMYLLLR